MWFLLEGSAKSARKQNAQDNDDDDDENVETNEPHSLVCADTHTHSHTYACTPTKKYLEPERLGG